MVSAHPEKGPASKGRNTVTWEEYSIKRGEKKNSLFTVSWWKEEEKKTKEGWFFFFKGIKRTCSLAIQRQLVDTEGSLFGGIIFVQLGTFFTWLFQIRF